MKNKFVKMTAAVLAGMMLLTGCGQSAGSTDVENGSTTQETTDPEQENKADNTVSGDKVKINRHSPYLSITLHKCYPYYLFGISTFPNLAYHSIALRKFSITIV